MDASVIVSIILAVVSLLGTLAVAVLGFFISRKLEEDKEKRDNARQLEELIARYSQPLLVVSYELGARLYELVEFPISKEHLETEEGLEDIKIFTCYKFAQFFAWSHILRSKTQYFSFTDDRDLDHICDVMLRLDEEFDRRRDDNNQNKGVWPGSRILVAERMIKNASNNNEVPLDTVVKSYNEFHKDWTTDFRKPMGYFCQWIDDMVDGRKQRQEHWDDAMRCTQHNLVDMVNTLHRKKRSDKAKALGQRNVVDKIMGWDKVKAPEKPLLELARCVPSAEGQCDCDVHRDASDTPTLEARQQSREGDQGLRPAYNPNADRAYDSSISQEALREMTSTELYNQGPRRRHKG